MLKSKSSFFFLKKKKGLQPFHSRITTFGWTPEHEIKLSTSDLILIKLVVTFVC